ncbi:hypothetical protein VNO80_02386 [Phaseolus coccineus]|uniref:Uncharacterized protein n=1 Tax=Phaseolus coccineus TaxID=3886 RepID=A0AAN9NPW2_PHACN
MKKLDRTEQFLLHGLLELHCNHQQKESAKTSSNNVVKIANSDRRIVRFYLESYDSNELTRRIVQSLRFSNKHSNCDFNCPKDDESDPNGDTGASVDDLQIHDADDVEFDDEDGAS